MHLRIVLGDFTALQPGPDHKRIHRPFDVLLLRLSLRRRLVNKTTKETEDSRYSHEYKGHLNVSDQRGDWRDLCPYLVLFELFIMWWWPLWAVV